MKLSPRKELELYVRMMPNDKFVTASFTLAAASRERTALEVIETAESFVQEASGYVGLKSKRLEVFPQEQKFTVEASPLLVRMMMDMAPGKVKNAQAVVQPK